MARRRKHTSRNFLLTLGVIVLVALLIVGGTNAAMIKFGEDKIFTTKEVGNQKAQCILVLGASVLPDGSPSEILRDRIDGAIDLYFAGAAPKIIMSGDNGTESYNEVEAMKRYAMSRGVPSEDIFCDHAGFSTYESVYRAQSIFGVENMIIVTQRYHLYRAVYAANGIGIEAIGVESDFHRYGGQLMFDIREIPARTKDFFQAAFKMPFAFDGVPISLSQSGDVTEE